MNFFLTVPVARYGSALWYYVSDTSALLNKSGVISYGATDAQGNPTVASYGFFDAWSSAGPSAAPYRIVDFTLHQMSQVIPAGEHDLMSRNWEPLTQIGQVQLPVRTVTIRISADNAYDTFLIQSSGSLQSVTADGTMVVVAALGISQDFWVTRLVDGAVSKTFHLGLDNAEFDLQAAFPPNPNHGAPSNWANGAVFLKIPACRWDHSLQIYDSTGAFVDYLQINQMQGFWSMDANFQSWFTSYYYLDATGPFAQGWFVFDATNNEAAPAGVGDLSNWYSQDATRDSDGDTLFDWYERLIGTRPDLTDSDGDLLPDDWELAHGYDPRISDNYNEDRDGDGLSVWQEWQAQTDPRKIDTDDDGIPDGWELDHGLNPLVSDLWTDSDGDGLSNAEEYWRGTLIWTRDTDGDGYEDGYEVAHGEDPLYPGDHVQISLPAGRAGHHFTLCEGGSSATREMHTTLRDVLSDPRTGVPFLGTECYGEFSGDDYNNWWAEWYLQDDTAGDRVGLSLQFNSFSDYSGCVQGWTDASGGPSARMFFLLDANRRGHSFALWCEGQVYPVTVSTFAGTIMDSSFGLTAPSQIIEASASYTPGADFFLIDTSTGEKSPLNQTNLLHDAWVPNDVALPVQSVQLKFPDYNIDGLGYSLWCGGAVWLEGWESRPDVSTVSLQAGSFFTLTRALDGASVTRWVTTDENQLFDLSADFPALSLTQTQSIVIADSISQVYLVQQDEWIAATYDWDHSADLWDELGVIHSLNFYRWSAAVDVTKAYTWVDAAGNPLESAQTPPWSPIPPGNALAVMVDDARRNDEIWLYVDSGGSWKIIFQPGYEWQTYYYGGSETVFAGTTDEKVQGYFVAYASMMTFFDPTSGFGIWNATTSQYRHFDADPSRNALDLTRWSRSAPLQPLISATRWMHGLEIHTDSGDVFPLDKGHTQGFWSPFGALGHADYVPYWYFDSFAMFDPDRDWWVYDKKTGERSPRHSTHPDLTVWAASDANADGDADGLPDWYEVLTGTSISTHVTPGNNHADGFDSNQNGVSDGAELALGATPANIDDDNDGVSNVQDQYPQDPRLSEDIPVQGYVAVSFAPVVFGSDYVGVWAAIDDVYRNGIVENRVGILGAKYTEAGCVAYKEVSFLLSEDLGTVANRVRTIAVQQVLGDFKAYFTAWGVNAIGTVIGEVSVRQYRNLTEHPRVPAPWPEVGTHAVKWINGVPTFLETHYDFYSGIKNSGVIWGGYSSTGPFVGDITSHYIDDGVGPDQLPRFHFESDPFGGVGGHSGVAESGAFSTRHSYRSNASDHMSGYDVSSVAYWDGYVFQHLFGGNDQDTNILALNSSLQMFGWSQRCDDVYPSPPLLPDPYVPPAPHPFWSNGSASQDFYRQLPLKYRRQIQFSSSPIDPTATSWALLNDANMLVAPARVLVRTSGTNADWGGTGTILCYLGSSRVQQIDIGNRRPQMLNANGIFASGAEILLPLEMMVDGNRDGNMSFTTPATHDSDETSAAKPFTFWINNDLDKGGTVDLIDWEEDDYEGDSDRFDDVIEWARDLEDFTRLWINLRGITQLINQGDVSVRLQWRPTDGSTWTNEDGDPGIRVFKAVEQGDGGRRYLEQEYFAWAQLDGVEGPGNHTNFSQGLNGGLVTRNHALELPKSLFVNAGQYQSGKFLLFEGYSVGKGRLVLTIDKGGHQVCEYPPLYLELKDVKDMYERWSVDPLAGVPAGVDYAIWPESTPRLLPNPSHKPFKSPADETNDYILSVHGWNMPPPDKDSYASTAFKRLWHRGYKGRFGAFYWPTFWSKSLPINPHHYDGSEERAWNSGPGLSALVASLNGGKFSGRIRLLAHSMGNIVAASFLRQANNQALLHSYVASQAAIPAHCYNQNAPWRTQYVTEDSPPNVYAYYWKPGSVRPPQFEIDQNPAYLAPQYAQNVAGNFINYFNGQDFALGIWQTGQDLKPDEDYYYTRLGVPLNGYVDFYRTGFPNGRNLTFPADTFEIFAWAARAYSAPLGRSASVGGIFNNPAQVDLNARWNYGNKHKGHSAQFRSTNMLRWRYWEQLLLTFDIRP